jgi:glyoxylase-like metal-dependent hydrolase (beta-lactamase superfamily II)
VFGFLETFNLGNRQVSVHHTPGETRGNICLQDSRYGILFTGDTFYTGTLWVHLEEADFEKYRESLSYRTRLLDQVKYLCPAHNGAYVPKEMFKAHEAFEQIAAGQLQANVLNNVRLYHFQGFNIALPNIA